jgi:hypothetical protein
MAGKKWVVDDTGKGRLVDLTPEQEQAQAEHKQLAATERPRRQKKRIERAAYHVVSGLVPAARQMDLASTLAEAAGKAPGDLTPKEVKARQARAWIKTVDARAEALSAAVDAGKKVNIRDGSIDGEGAWPSKPGQ